MPSSYTIRVSDGTITNGKEFLMLCSRAFGIAVAIKDQPLSVPTPTEFTPSPFFKECYDNSVKKYEYEKTRSIDSVRTELLAKHNEDVANAKNRIDEYNTLINKFKKILNDVECWQPPTSEHEGIKKFAIEEINKAIAENQEYIDMCNEVIAKSIDTSNEAIEKYIQDNLEVLRNGIEFNKKIYEHETELAKSRTKFMQEFIKSLENL